MNRLKTASWTGQHRGLDRSQRLRGSGKLLSSVHQFFADMARSIHLLTQKNQTIVWKDEQRESFERLKHSLVIAPVLSLPRDVGRYVLDSDASDEALGIVLQQEQDGLLKFIVYVS